MGKGTKAIFLICVVAALSLLILWSLPLFNAVAWLQGGMLDIEAVGAAIIVIALGVVVVGVLLIGRGEG
jgi:hypothetical protein